MSASRWSIWARITYAQSLSVLSKTTMPRMVSSSLAYHSLSSKLITPIVDISARLKGSNCRVVSFLTIIPAPLLRSLIVRVPLALRVNRNTQTPGGHRYIYHHRSLNSLHTDSSPASPHPKWSPGTGRVVAHVDLSGQGFSYSHSKPASEHRNSELNRSLTSFKKAQVVEPGFSMFSTKSQTYWSGASLSRTSRRYRVVLSFMGSAPFNRDHAPRTVTDRAELKQNGPLPHLIL